ncbi:MAG: GGDEF domain-containing protein [Candidatus Nanopelagicales bacterium]
MPISLSFLGFIALAMLAIVVLIAGVIIGILAARFITPVRERVFLESDDAVLPSVPSQDGVLEIITVIDNGECVLYQSPHVAKILGFEPGRWIGGRLVEMVRDEDKASVAEALASVRETGRPQTVMIDLRKSDGAFYRSETQILANESDGTAAGFICISRDSSRWQKGKAPAAPIASETDELTDLPTRAALRQFTAESLKGAPPAQVSVLAVDIDGFGALNDMLGYELGDDILRRVTAVINRSVRPWDVVARIGADEFAILIVGSNTDRAVGRVHERLQRSLAGVVVEDGREIRLTVSMGYAVNTLGTESAEELLRNAEVALTRARSAVRIDIVRFEATMHDAIVERVQAEHELREALALRQLELMYQPIVRLSDYRIIGAEALVRWNHPERGLLAAGEFVPLAEEMGLVHELGAWALRRACRDAADFRSLTQESDFKISVNVSGQQIDSGLVVAVQNATRDVKLDPTGLVLEVTESVLAERPDEAAQVLQRIRAAGCRVALDDFGTGYSSLAYLAKFPVDVLKIDRSFVSELSNSSEQLALARTIVSLGQALSLDVVAEGVESSAHADILRGMGCKFAQGFVFSKPVPRSQLLLMLNDQESGNVKFAGIDALAEDIVDQARNRTGF